MTLARVMPLFILGFVVAAIAVREVGGRRVPIWIAMLVGASAMAVLGAVGLIDQSPREAAESIDLDVIGFLAGMFVVGHALELSGGVERLTSRAASMPGGVDGLVVGVLAGSGVAAAILLNDTIAVVGTPVVVGLARARGVRPRLLILALAFGITIGSVASPIGNPQNLLIALHGRTLDGGTLANPFATFLRWLLVPTLASLALGYGVLRVAFADDFRPGASVQVDPPETDRALNRLSCVAVAVLLVLIGTRVAASLTGAVTLRLTVIAFVPAALLLALSPRRVSLARGIDVRTLLFFAGLFVVVAGVEASGVAADVATRLGSGVREPGTVLAASGALSQVVSNVPFVALYLHILGSDGASERALMALAAGSTLAGNLTILGAASNVIIVEHAERRFDVRVSFFEFLRAGIPLTLGSLAICWIALR